MESMGIRLKRHRKKEMGVSRRKFTEILRDKEKIDMTEFRLLRIENGTKCNSYSTDVNSRELLAICRITGKGPNYWLGWNE